MKFIESLKRIFRQETKDNLNTPRVGIVKIYPMPCYICQKPLENGNRVIITDSAIRHFECGILVKNENGDVILGHPNHAVLFLYEDEWKDLKHNITDTIPLREL